MITKPPTIYRFNYHPINGYTCSHPGDNTGYYVNLNDYERLGNSGLPSQETAPDPLLKYSTLIQVFENEITLRVGQMRNNPERNAEFNQGFLNALLQAKYMVNELVQKHKIGYMGDVGGVGCDPSDV